MADHDPVQVVFVCWGNICRSPIAERVARRAAHDAGLVDVEFTSAATSAEELGAPMDPRAAKVLQRDGYDPAGHVAHQIDADELDRADLVIAMEDVHVRLLRRVLGGETAPGAAYIHLLSEFDPQAAPGSGLTDPWYGPDSAFTDTLRAVESAMPGVLAAVRGIQGHRR